MHQPLALAVQPRRQSCGEICRHATMHVACWCMHLGLHTQPITRHRRFKALINWPSIYMGNSTTNFHILINGSISTILQRANSRGRQQDELSFKAQNRVVIMWPLTCSHSRRPALDRARFMSKAPQHSRVGTGIASR